MYMLTTFKILGKGLNRVFINILAGGQLLFTGGQNYLKNRKTLY